MSIYSGIIPHNTNASLYNAWFRKEYPELFSDEDTTDTKEAATDDKSTTSGI